MFMLKPQLFNQREGLYIDRFAKNVINAREEEVLS